MPQGSFGRVRVFEDFLSIGHFNGAWTETGLTAVGQLTLNSVNEGALAHVIDESGGVLSVTTDTGSADNAALYVGVFVPSDGGCVMEARFKVLDIANVAVYCGFTETLHATTPVMPAEFDTVTMTYNDSGGMVGFSFDKAGTTATWRAIAGDGGAVASNADANGTVSGEGAPVNDEYDIMRVEIDPNGDARCYHDGELIKSIATAVTAGDVQHAVLIIENRTATAGRVLEVDYFYASGSRDWTV